MQIHSDCQKLRRFALHLLAAGDLRRYGLILSGITPFITPEVKKVKISLEDHKKRLW